MWANEDCTVTPVANTAYQSLWIKFEGIPTGSKQWESETPWANLNYIEDSELGEYSAALYIDYNSQVYSERPSNGDIWQMTGPADPSPFSSAPQVVFEF